MWTYSRTAWRELKHGNSKNLNILTTVLKYHHLVYIKQNSRQYMLQYVSLTVLETNVKFIQNMLQP